ncbi:MAG: ABC transporter permease [Saprospiraceae bacterium]|nr:ABC transporter permease [Saprospiraceae bacterium]
MIKRTTQILAFSFLIICLFSAVFAYVLISDKTRHANNQIPDCALWEPMQKACIRCDLVFEQKENWISRYFTGLNSTYKCQLSNSENNIQENCFYYLFGADKFGRDVFSRVVLGLRYTLLISLSAVLLSLIIGLVLGGLAGYFGGKTDQIISVFVNVFWSLPTILLAFAVILSFGRNMFSIFIAISLTMWGDVARLVRGLVLKHKEYLYVQAAKTLGYSRIKIIFKEIIPNLMGPVWVNAAGNFALAVLLESGLSFLGFGLQPPVPTLGNILQEQYVYAISGKPMLALIPSIIVVLLILSFQVFTNYLRDRNDLKKKH